MNSRVRGRTERAGVAILGNYGNRNLGDEACLAALLHAIHARRPDARLYAISFDPQDTVARHGVPALPAWHRAGRPSATAEPAAAAPFDSSPALRRVLIERLKVVLLNVPAIRPLFRRLRWLARLPANTISEAMFLARTVRALRSVGCLVMGGGGQLSDDIGGAWAFPYLVLKWTVLARVVGSCVLFLNVGAGPLDSGLGRIFVRLALRLAAYRSFRDLGSQAVAAKLGIAGIVQPDLAWAVPISEPRVVARSTESLAVGLNPFPYQDARYWPGGQRSQYEAYLDALAGLAQGLLERQHAVVLFPTQLRADPLVIEDIRALLATRNPSGLPGRLEERRVETMDDLLATLAPLDLVVSGRFHGVLFSLLLGKPVVAVSYQSKIDELMESAGQGAHVVSISGMKPAALGERVGALEADRTGIATYLANEAPHRKQVLERQFDALFS